MWISSSRSTTWLALTIRPPSAQTMPVAGIRCRARRRSRCSWRPVEQPRPNSRPVSCSPGCACQLFLAPSRIHAGWHRDRRSTASSCPGASGFPEPRASPTAASIAAFRIARDHHLAGLGALHDAFIGTQIEAALFVALAAGLVAAEAMPDEDRHHVVGETGLGRRGAQLVRGLSFPRRWCLRSPERSPRPELTVAAACECPSFPLVFRPAWTIIRAKSR